MKTLHIFSAIAVLLLCTVIATQGGDKKVLVKTELASSPAIVCFTSLDLVYISSPTEEIIPWLDPEKVERISKGFITQVFHPPATGSDIFSTINIFRC